MLCREIGCKHCLHDRDQNSPSEDILGEDKDDLGGSMTGDIASRSKYNLTVGVKDVRIGFPAERYHYFDMSL